MNEPAGPAGAHAAEAGPVRARPWVVLAVVAVAGAVALWPQTVLEPRAHGTLVLRRSA